MAEERKLTKYQALLYTHTLSSVATETSGVTGPKLLAFLKDLVMQNYLNRGRGGVSVAVQ